MNRMFQSAAVKLTLWYLAIIMVLSIGFSVVLYSLSSGDLERNIERQLGVFYRVLAPEDFDSFAALRQRQLNQDLNHLKDNLVLFNLVVLTGGGGASYFLARRTLKPIEESLDAQKRFTGDASHELRTPLAAIRSEIEVALRDPKLTKAQAVALLKSNLEEVDKLRSLSDGLLRLASEEGKLPEFVSIPLSEVIDEVLQRQQHQLAAKKIKLDKSIKDVAVRGDHQSLVELFNIIIDNAIKYSPSGGEVSVSAARKHKQVVVTISDKGQGIAPIDLPRIFDRFYRADSSRSKNEKEGYGLGLAIAKKIADLHGGFIEVKSAPAKGSTFTTYLPVS
jgi:two-component system sensor histidine kinase CiaH